MYFTDKQNAQLKALNALLGTITEDSVLDAVQEQQVVDTLKGTQHDTTTVINAMLIEMQMTSTELDMLKVTVDVLQADIRSLIVQVKENTREESDFTQLCSKNGIW